MAYLDARALYNIKSYKYKGVDLSLITKYFLDPWWSFVLAKFIPETMAPNLVTLTGFMFVVINFLCMIYFCPDMFTPAPWWLYLSCAIGLFIYQTLDGVDGKQARKTKTGSALGQLFDHGCDALNCSLGVATICSSVRAGASCMTWVTLWSTLAQFYFATWDEYHTGCLTLWYINGPAEGLLIVMFGHLSSALFGTDYWIQDYKTLLNLQHYDFLPSMQFNNLLLSLNIGFATLMGVVNIFSVLHTVALNNKSRLTAFSHLIPFFTHAGIASLWYYFFPTAFENNPHLVILTHGLMFSYMVAKMIVKHLSDEPFPLFHFILVPQGVFLCYSLLAPVFGLPILSQDTFIRLHFIISTAMYVEYAKSIISELTKYLGINVLTIKKNKS